MDEGAKEIARVARGDLCSRGESSGRPADTTAAAPAFGAFHNTDVWHPFFDYLSANDLADITAVVRIPSEYYLTTTVPQTDSVKNGVRTVYSRSMHSAFLLALIYDRDWQPKSHRLRQLPLRVVRRPDLPSLARLARCRHEARLRFARATIWRAQFPSRYLAAAQDRSLGAGGFSVRMNNTAISGSAGGSLGSRASQTFGTRPGTPGRSTQPDWRRSFLHEAWATFVEGLMLRAFYTADDERAFWEAMRDSYMVGNDRAGFAGGFEGNQSILANYDNGRIHYRKGVWILYSGNYVMGDSAFNRGMRLYIDGMGKGPAGYEELIVAWSKAAGHSMRSFVMPWLTSKYIPDVEATVDGNRLIVTQRQPGELFDLPKLDIELTTPSGNVRRTLHLQHRADTVMLRDVGTVSEIHVDPDHRFLLQRHWGEPIVRFELPVSVAPTATSMSLNGNFVRGPIPATKNWRCVGRGTADDRRYVHVALAAERWVGWSRCGAGARFIVDRSEAREAVTAYNECISWTMIVILMRPSR